MFTGIVEELGAIKEIRRGAQSARLTVGCTKVLEGTGQGDSIAVNGVCLTVTSFDKNSFSADVMHETMRASSLSLLKPGSQVNLERALALGSRLGGHIVSGHIDGTGTITQVKEDDNAVWYTVKAPWELLRYIVSKGSVALDGISLTVAEVKGDSFKVSTIPHTRANTNLAGKRPGDVVNIENDVIAKYVERLAVPPPSPSNSPHTGGEGITLDFLAKNGF